MTLEETLARLGIEGRRARFYLAALEVGEAPVTAVARKAGVGRTTAYDLLSRLVRDGLVTQVEKSGRVHVLAEDPATLLQRLDERRALLTSALPQLRSVYNRSTVKPRIHFYEGADGIRTVLLDRLQCRSRRLRGILSMQDLMEVPGRQEMDRLIQLRIDAGIQLQAIRSRAKEVEHIWPSRASDLRELRYAPEGLVFAMTTYIYDQRVSFISTRRESFGMIVESEELAALQDNYFEVLWRVSEPAPEYPDPPGRRG